MFQYGMIQMRNKTNLNLQYNLCMQPLTGTSKDMTNTTLLASIIPTVLITIMSFIVTVVLYKFQVPFEFFRLDFLFLGKTASIK